MNVDDHLEVPSGPLRDCQELRAAPLEASPPEQDGTSTRSDVPEFRDHAHAGSGSIVCATDFSDVSASAFEVAARLARRLSESLVLVHAVNDTATAKLPGDIRESLALYARAQFHAQCEQLREWNVRFQEAFHYGNPQAVVLEAASDPSARLLVMGSGRRPRIHRWAHGSLAEHVAEAAETPTLLVRDPVPLIQWLKGERRLRIVLGADLSTASDSAIRLVEWLRHLGPTEIFIAYFEPQAMFPPSIAYPLALVDDLDTETTRRQERFFRKRIRILFGQDAHIWFEKAWAFSDAHLIQRAAQVRSDLLVVGTHSRTGSHQSGRRPISRGIIHYAPFNVMSVPEMDPTRQKTIFTTKAPNEQKNMNANISIAHSDTPDAYSSTGALQMPKAPEPSLEFKNILVPLDMSENSLKALRYAIPFARLFGAELTLLHVLDLKAYTPELPEPPPLPADKREVLTSQLEEIRRHQIPDDIEVRLMVRHNFVFEAILEAAHEVHADLIVATTHGRSGLMHMVMGSTAENIVRKAPCPVLVIRPTGEADA